MDIIKRNRILIGLVVALLVINIALVATIIAKNMRNTRSVFKHKRDFRHNKKDKCFTDFLSKELALTKEQTELYQKANSEHLSQLHKLRGDIRKQKQQIHNELFKENPDTLLIKNLTDSVGVLNAKFERANYYYFLGLKDFLDEQQLKRLKEIMNHHSFTGKRPPHHKHKGERSPHHKRNKYTR